MIIFLYPLLLFKSLALTEFSISLLLLSLMIVMILLSCFQVTTQKITKKVDNSSSDEDDSSDEVVISFLHSLKQFKHTTKPHVLNCHFTIR